MAQVFDRHFQNFALDVRRARQRFAKLEQQTLRICAPDATLAENFSGLDFPGLLQFVALTDGDILREITHQTADIAVLASHVDAENYVVRRLSTARVQLLMPKTWSPDVPSYKETARLCANHDYCAGTWGDDIEDLLVETLELPARPVARTVCTDWSTVEARVHAQRAWALIPSDSAKEGRGYWHIELPDSFRGQTSFIYVLRSVAAASWFQTASAGIW